MSRRGWRGHRARPRVGSRRPHDALAHRAVDRGAIRDRLRDRSPRPLRAWARRRSISSWGAFAIVHFYAAIVFTLAVVSRIAWMFVGQGHAPWREFIPVDRERRAGLVPMLQFYLFARRGIRSTGSGTTRSRRPPISLVFCLYVVMIVTGLGMYAIDAGAGSPVAWARGLLPIFGGATGRPLDPPRDDVAAARLLRPPPLQRAAHFGRSSATGRWSRSSPGRSGSRASSSSTTRRHDDRDRSTCSSSALGNPLCGDDGAGVAAVARLRERYDAAAGRRRARRRYARPLAAAVPAPGAHGHPRRRHRCGRAPRARSSASRETTWRPRLRIAYRRIRSAWLTSSTERGYSVDTPKTIVLVGVVPAQLELSIERSPAVEARIDDLVRATVEEAARMGHVFTRQGNRCGSVSAERSS